MKQLTFLLISLLPAFGGSTAPFQNLDFEQANTNNVQVYHPGTPRGYLQGSGSTTDLVPGWQLYSNTNLLTTIGYNFVPDFGPLLTDQEFSSNTPAQPVAKGDYGMEFGLEPFVKYSIAQQGDVPLGAIGLTFSNLLGAPFVVSMNGVPLKASMSSHYDVSPFAGQNVELKFETMEGGFFGFSTLDDISFIIPGPVFVENDFNGDGALDVVFEHADGSIGVWFMNKGPDLISASFFNPGAVADPRWHIVGTGNFTETNTNKTDLLFQHEDGSLAVWSMHVTNLFSTALLNPSQPGGGWKVVGTGDMNHDGKKDILFQHDDGTLGVWFMDGINLVQGALLNPNKPGDSGWRVVGTAALSSVGNADLIFQHSDGTLAAWYMNGTNLVQGVLLNPSAPGQEGWRVATTIDLNADGKTDLLFQHDDGTVAVWLMDGINLISGEFLNPENPGDGWRIAGPR